MLYIGNHLSTTQGFMGMGREAVALDANTFAFFTRNPRGGKAKAWDEKDLANFKVFAREHGFTKLVAHAPYTYNPCSDKEHIKEFAREAMAEDLQRLEALPGNYYNFHPGSHVGAGAEAAIPQIADCLNAILRPEQQTTVLLETMAGKGTEVGRTFQEIKAIIDRVNLQDKLGVCLDTCHIWDGGYDITHRLDEVLDEFDKIIGLDKLKAVHLNDSKNPLGAHKDRHEKIGEGYIGLDTLVAVINHPKLRGLPFILETPNDHDGYAREIALLRSKYHEA